MNNHSTDPYSNMKISSFISVCKSEIKNLIRINSFILSFGLIFLIFFYPPTFKSSATIIHNGSTLDSSQLASGLLTSIGLPFSSGMGSTSPSEVSLQILKSHSFANDILFTKFYSDKFDQKIELFKILLEDESINIVFEKNKINTSGREILYDAKKFFLEDVLYVEKNRITNVINFSVVTSEPELSYDLANVIINYLNNQFNEIDIIKAEQKKNFIRGRLNIIEIELLELERDYIEFKNTNKSINQSTLLQIEENTLRRKVDLHVALLSSLRQQLEIVEMEVYDQINELAIISAPEIPAYRDNRRIFLLFGFIILGLFVSILNVFRILLSYDKKT